MNIETLIRLSKQPSYRMPSGLTREQRRAWAAEIVKRVKS